MSRSLHSIVHIPGSAETVSIFAGTDLGIDSIQFALGEVTITISQPRGVTAASPIELLNNGVLSIEFLLGLLREARPSREVNSASSN